MRVRLLLSIAGLFAVMAAGEVASVEGREPGRLEAFALRHDLHQETCCAMADGSISRSERAGLLLFARNILKAEEYKAFRQTLNRVSPPKKSRGRHVAKKVVKTKPSPVVRSKPTPASRPAAQVAAQPLTGLVIPVSAIFPDRMASSSVVR